MGQEKDKSFVIRGPLGGIFESEEAYHQRWSQLEIMAKRRQELSLKRDHEGLSQDENIELTQLVSLGSSC